ncbi:MAG: glycosyltransferase [Chitinophagaceae bacterium]|nr:glycosyltransferase [Chitinophagaceae bacterium]
MKILIVGSDKIFSIENFYFRYLRLAGVDVQRFDAQSIFYDYYYGGSIFRKIYFKMRLSPIFKRINQKFETMIAAYQPNIIWVFKGMEIFPESLIFAKKMGIKLVNYNPDNPFVFSGTGSGNKNITDAISLYDLHFTYNFNIEEQLVKKYNIKTAILPFGFDVDEGLFAKCAAQPEIIRACFLGNPDAQRASFLEEVASHDIYIDVYGNNWAQFVTNKNIRVFKPVYGENLWMTLRKYRVQINIMRIHNEDSHNMRSFEIPGIGGIQLAPFTKEHCIFFEPGKDIFLYKSARECADLIMHVLSLDKSEADKIRSKAREMSIIKKYSYRDRANQALSVIRSLFSIT